MNEPKRIFILDDDAEFLNETGRMLEETGYEVETCHQPTKSLMRIRLFRPDCVLLDIRMPMMDGRELLPWLRRQWPSLPVVIVTGVHDLPLNEFLKQDVFCILDKPFTAQRLFQAIHQAILKTPDISRRTA